MSQWLILTSLTLCSGTGIRLKGVANGLVCNGKHVYLVGGGEYEHIGPGVKHIQVKGSSSPLVTAFRLLVANLVAVVRIRPQYCIASKPLPHTVIPALLAQFMGAVTFLDFDDLESGYWQDRFRLPLLRLLEKISPRLLHFTCVHTEELAEEVTNNAGLDQSRVLRLDQGVDVSLFSPRPVEKLPRSQVILYAAHLGVAAKGLYFVLEGFRNLAEKGVDAILLVVGGGPLMPAFQEKARRLGLDGMVVFTGQLDHRCMPKIMRLARGAVNYLEPENSANRYRASVKVREYLCMGLPVATNMVGSDLTPFLPFLDVFAAGDVEGFARAVEQALARGRSEDAHRELKNNWAWEVVVGSFLRQLRQLKG